MVRIYRIKCKKAFSPTKIPGAKYVINPYIGCQHACLYCYTKFMCRWYPYGKWSNWIIVKENMPEIVKNKKVDGKVYMGSVCDVYQPIEKKLEHTRKILISMSKNIDLTILTKSDLALRDIDIFKEFCNIEVGLTINSFSGSIKNVLEPYSSTNEQRIEALKELHDNNIKNFAFISPIIPCLADVEELIKKTKNFTDFYWFEFLNLKSAGKEFKDWLKNNYPESYEILLDKQKCMKYVNDVIKIIREQKVKVKGIYVHNFYIHNF